MATERMGFFEILSESRKITRSHYRHFLALSVLFILPLSFLIIAFPTLQHSITHINTPLVLRLHRSNSIDSKPIIFSLYVCSLVTLFLCSIATVSYSVHHGFFDHPVKLIYAFRSLSNSLIRLFLTFLSALFMILVMCLGIGLIVIGVAKGIEPLGFEVEYYWGFYVVGLSVLGLGFVWLYVNWVLAPVIVVVESSWGLEALRRSAYLVKGMRSVVVSVCLMFCFGVMMWYPVFLFGNWDLISYGDGFWGRVNFVIQILCGCTMLMTFLLSSLAANTVLYINCKALHEELAGEIAPDYVSLPYDEEKVPHLVSVAQP